MFDIDNLSLNRIMILTQCDIAEVQGHSLALQQFVSGPLYSRVTCMGMILHIIVVRDPGIFVAGGICLVRTCLVFIYICTINCKKETSSTQQYHQKVEYA